MDRRAWRATVPGATKTDTMELWCPKDERTSEQAGSWNGGREQTRALSSSPPRVVTINELQVLLSRITCLPFHPTGRRHLPSSPHPVYLPHPIST